MGSTADSLDQMDSTMGDMDSYQQDLFSVRCPFIAGRSTDSALHYDTTSVMSELLRVLPLS